MTPKNPLSSKKTPTSLKETQCLVSLTENRSREIGLALLNLNSFDIKLTQFVDNPNYIHILSLLYAWDPIEILICKTLEDSPLHHLITSNLSGIPLSFISRKFYDEIKGEELCKSSLQVIYDQDVEKKYVCMAALAGLIAHYEASQNISIFKEKLKISLIYLKDFLVIDIYSLRSLELILSLEGQRKGSLSSFFDCRTQAGLRMLRSSLLQPIKDKHRITSRQESVHELMNAQVASAEIKICLADFANTELVTSRLLQRPKTVTEKFMKSQITNLLNIFNNVRLSKSLLNLLIKYELKSAEICEVRELLDDRRIDELINDIGEMLSDEILAVKTKNLPFFECINCMKDGLNTLLDVNRGVYKGYLEDIHKLETSYRYKLTDPSLCIVFTNVRGYHLQFNSNVLRYNYQNTLGEHLLQITHKKQKSQATTPSLISLNEKIKISQSNIISLNFSMIENICNKARDKLLVLYNISHAVACLDFLIACSAFSLNFTCTRPRISSEKIRLKNARNPLLLSRDKNVPVSISFNYYKKVFILTGNNSSGKTTFMKTIALNSILAHAGSFIPAEKGTVCSLDYILTKLSERESIENRNSSFMAEMKDAGYILSTINRKSLVLIDEIGKGTSRSDGSAIAWSICERIYESQCFCVFSTHFIDLCEMEKIYLGLRNISMKDYVKVKGPIKEGVGYGLMSADQSSLPRSMCNRALEIFQQNFGTKKNAEVDERFNRNKKLVLDVMNLIRSVKDPGMIEQDLLGIKFKFFNN